MDQPGHSARVADRYPCTQTFFACCNCRCGICNCTADGGLEALLSELDSPLDALPYDPCQALKQQLETTFCWTCPALIVLWPCLCWDSLLSLAPTPAQRQEAQTEAASRAAGPAPAQLEASGSRSSNRVAPLPSDGPSLAEQQAGPREGPLEVRNRCNYRCWYWRGLTRHWGNALGQPSMQASGLTSATSL